MLNLRKSFLNIVALDQPQKRKKNNFYPIELSNINKDKLVKVSSCINTESTRDDPYWTSRKNS